MFIISLPFAVTVGPPMVLLFGAFKSLDEESLVVAPSFLDGEATGAVADFFIFKSFFMEDPREEEEAPG